MKETAFMELSMADSRYFARDFCFARSMLTTEMGGVAETSA